MKVFILVIAMLTFSIGYGQEAKNNDIPEEGTYQIIVKGGKVKWLFTKEILIGMERKRLENESYSVKLSEDAFLYLPSKQVINGPEFEKLEAVLYE